MSLKWLRTGLLLITLMVTACGGNNNNTCPTSQAVTTCPLPNATNLNGIAEGVVRSDPIDLAPGTSIEVETPTPTPPPANIEPVYGSVIIKNTKLNLPVGSSTPEVVINGYLPTPCHKLIFKVDALDPVNQISIHILSAANLQVACAQKLQPFEQTIHLTNIPSGSYVVWINGNKLGGIKIP